jgi:hypothetical protein
MAPQEIHHDFPRTTKDQEELFAEILEIGASLPSALKGKLPTESESPLGTAGNSWESGEHAAGKCRDFFRISGVK